MPEENTHFKSTIEFEEQVSEQGRPIVVAKIIMELPDFEQNQQLPNEVERLMLRAGQQFMKGSYQVVMELADRELIIKKRGGKEGKGIQRIGTRPYTIKTKFGRVVVRRIRIKHKSDGSTEIPSKEQWQLPARMLVTEGLKTATCNIVVKQSYASTVQQLAWQTGEPKILSKSSVSKILHTAGSELAGANEQRAASVYQCDAGVKRLLGRAESYISEEWFEDVFLNGKEIREEDVPDIIDEIVWDPRELSIITTDSVTEDSLPEHTIDKAIALATITEQNECLRARASTECSVNEPREVIIVEPDEVVVASQEKGRQWEINYSAVVSKGKESYYFTAATSAELWYQVASLLGKLKAQSHQLLLLSDGAKWIEYWFDGLRLAEKASVTCWFHLKERCWRSVREAVNNKEVRLTIYRALMKQLWRGQVETAREYLKQIITDVEDGISKIIISDIEVLEKLRQYLMDKCRHIPDYLCRMRAGERIANTKVEKFRFFDICRGRYNF